MSFIEKLTQTIEKNQSLLCVGLDPNEKNLPEGDNIQEKLLLWAGNIISQTKYLVCCYKPNMAFFEQFGLEGLEALQVICRELIPADVPVLLDAIFANLNAHAPQLLAQFAGRTFTAVGQKQILLVIGLQPGDKLMDSWQHVVAMIKHAVHVANESLFFSNFIHATPIIYGSAVIGATVR